MSDQPKDTSASVEPEDLEVEAAEAGDVKGGHEIVSPRDPASGLPTGKRQHKPFTLTTGN